MSSLAAEIGLPPVLDCGLRGIELHWPDGHDSFFHHVWLRDACYCETCGDPYSSKRYLRPSDIALDIAPRLVELVPGDALHIVWETDGHESRYQLAWLRDNCYAEAARTLHYHHATHWDATISNALPEVSYPSVSKDEASRHGFLRKLRDFGFVVVRDGPRDLDGVEEVAGLIGEMAESAYGKVFDLSPKSKHKTLGNTMKPVPPHTDEAYRHCPPGINVLHCVRPAPEGGESVLVDGFKLGEVLRGANPEAFELLVTQPQTFYRVAHEKGIDQRARGPVFRLDDEGSIVGFRFHTRTAGPLHVSPEKFEAVYAANHALSALMMNERYHACFRLEAGDAVLFDNHRVMHSRKGFNDQDRMLRICNVSREQFHEQFRLSAHRLGFHDEGNQILSAGVTG